MRGEVGGDFPIHLLPFPWPSLLWEYSFAKGKTDSTSPTRSRDSQTKFSHYFFIQQNPSKEFAETIFKTFLGTESQDEVDTDPKIKKQIWANIETGNVQHDLFDKLQIQVFSCMAQDNFFRFQNYMISRLAIL